MKQSEGSIPRLLQAVTNFCDHPDIIETAANSTILAVRYKTLVDLTTEVTALYEKAASDHAVGMALQRYQKKLKEIDNNDRRNNNSNSTL